MGSNTDATKNFCSGTNIDMTLDNRKAGLRACTYGDLLKNKAVRAYLSIRMDDNTIWMGDQETSTDFEFSGISAPLMALQNR